MPRFKLTVEYSGAPFAGWQRQADAPSVQQAIEEALRKLEPAAPPIIAAGRTDAGVHATGQVVHCDLEKDWDPFRLNEALNRHLLPAPVAILAVRRVDFGFNARFSALERRYRYKIVNRRAPLTFDRGLAWRVKPILDLAAMAEGAAHLLGRHDFTTFRSSQCQADSPLRTLDSFAVHPTPQGCEITARARSFLHHQVRSMVGSLAQVGMGRWPAIHMREILEARDRAACGPLAPSDGLYLEAVRYPEPWAD